VTEGTTALLERAEELGERLDALALAPDADDARDELKAEIIALYRTVDHELATLGALKDRIRDLVDRWKAMRPAALASAVGAAVAAGVSEPDGEAAASPSHSFGAPLRADHLGASTFIEKGWSKLSAGDHAGAEESLERALALTPDDPQALSLLGWAQMLREKYDEALANFQRALMKQPANALARVNLGYVCLKKGIFGEAIEHLSKAIRLDNDPKATLYAHYYLGLVYLEREMFDDAQTFFRKALALGPNLVEARFQLGCALWRSGGADDAREAWRAGASASKFNPWGRRCGDALAAAERGESPL
jgi:tetratricopeptide (TPR) repeat protein